MINSQAGIDLFLFILQVKKNMKDYKRRNKQKSQAKHKLDWIKFESAWT